MVAKLYCRAVDRQESVNLICLEFISQVLAFSGFVIGCLEGISRGNFVERQPELFAHSINAVSMPSRRSNGILIVFDLLIFYK